MSIERAYGPREEVIHSETTAEIFENLLRKILSSNVTSSLFSIRSSIFWIRILVLVEIINFFIFLPNQL